MSHEVFERVERLTVELADARESSARIEQELAAERGTCDELKDRVGLHERMGPPPPDSTYPDTFKLIAKMWAAIVILALLAIARMS